ncbi:effector-associated constant component EACC1 [Streptomyces sp. NPDC001642]|uniref:effector-associated constant component EACC1 n=1 Tax=Streptomyces sp. NPDC001642 TaxID=3154392 RepID=UPI0033272A24
MHIVIESVAQDDRGTISDLYRWLGQDPEVRRYVTATLDSRPESPTAMGAVEVINLVLGQGFTALNLALAYASWRNARPAAPPITITVGIESITVQDASEETVRCLAEALQSAISSVNGEEVANVASIDGSTSD